MEAHVYQWISQHGYPAIFFLLVLGIVGLPVPDETLLTFTGYLVFKGKLDLRLAFFSAFFGSVCGITISYILGRTFGIALIHRYGKYLHISEASISRAHSWFERLGRWTLTIGYFIPGVRHFTAYAAGISDLEPHYFAAFAYSGAFLWASAFIGLGYWVGDNWQVVEGNYHKGLIVLGVVAAIGVGAWFAWRKYATHRT
ncbi:MAG TPA: DedA family protein [Bryobacteraceae bacterium]|nr:DedA family protein [Bryobacteraceae bacterium]